MQNQVIRRLAIAAVFVIIAVLTGGAVTANAQYNYDNYYPPTPPQGPPAASGNTSITIDSFITPEVFGRIDQAISDNNSCYSRVKSGAASCFRATGVDDNDKCIWGCTKNGVFIPRPTSAAIITVTKKRYSPWLAQTLYPDRPNENQALISYFMIYNLSQIWGCSGVCFDYPFSRTVSQSIDLYMACAGWQTGTGGLTVTTVLAPAYMDHDHSLLEDTLFGILWNNVIPGFVDSRIRSALSSFGAGTSSKKLGTTDSDGVFHPTLCNRLGVSSFSDAPSLESVNFDFIRPPRFPNLLQQITVQITQVRRLSVHDFNGGVIRYPTEYPQLEFYAGYSKLVLTLPPMLEGQTYFPTATAAVSVPVPPSTGKLVLIATMWETAHNIRDPGFVVFDSSSNWGSGTRTLNTPKIWFELNPIFRKPILMRAKGYELTLQITTPTFTTATF
ncbi:MAG TPA: hypothetical protein VE422_18785 [Terriglobia bacterium]|nr:hypothetical protein [Terriglobia bacterium]